MKSPRKELDNHMVVSIFEEYCDYRFNNFTHKKAVEFICVKHGDIDSTTVKKCLTQAENLGYYWDYSKLRKKIKKQVNKLFEIAKPYWSCGDGEGGCVFEIIEESLQEQGLSVFHCINTRTILEQESNTPKKKRISHTLQKRVFERDEFRCKHCGTYVDLTVDHIKPESKGGSLDMDNLQTLCRSCNSKKGTTF